MFAGKCLEGTARYSVADQCDAYVECVRGEPTEKLCPDGLMFNDKVRPFAYPCQYPIDVDCGNRSKVQPAEVSLIYKTKLNPNSTIYILNKSIPRMQYIAHPRMPPPVRLLPHWRSHELRQVQQLRQRTILPVRLSRRSGLQLEDLPLRLGRQGGRLRCRRILGLPMPRPSIPRIRVRRAALLHDAQRLPAILCVPGGTSSFVQLR